MHRHQHHHHHGHHDDHSHSHSHEDGHHHHHHDHPPHGGPGHNHARPPRAVAQWQTPHKPQGTAAPSPVVEPDLDKVEAAFAESFFAASDPTSFLRLARIPFETVDAAGRRLHLLRVEIDALTDVGSLTPHLGGDSFRYDPLPTGLLSRRRRLRFVYFDGETLRGLSYAELRTMED